MAEQISATEVSLSGPYPTPAAKRVHDDRGMTTAEYAVGTVAAATLGGILIKVLSDSQVFDFLLKLVLWILKTFTGFGG